MKRGQGLTCILARRNACWIAECNDANRSIRELLNIFQLRIERNNQNERISQKIAPCSGNNQPFLFQVVHRLGGGGDEQIHRSALIDLRRQGSGRAEVVGESNVCMTLLINGLHLDDNVFEAGGCGDSQCYLRPRRTSTEQRCKPDEECKRKAPPI